MDKKQQELHILKEFLSIHPIDVLSLTPNESPDFDVLSSSCSIGIEITQYQIDSDLTNIFRSNEASCKRIFKKLESEFLIDFPNTYLITVLFHEANFTYRKKECDDIFEFIAAEFSRLISSGKLVEPNDRQELKYDRNLYFEYINFSVRKKEDPNAVTMNGSYACGNVPLEKFHELIKKKERLMNFQRNQATWLIIYFSGDTASDVAFPEDIQLLPKLTTKFEKIFVMTLRPKTWLSEVNKTESNCPD